MKSHQQNIDAFRVYLRYWIFHFKSMDIIQPSCRLLFTTRGKVYFISVYYHYSLSFYALLCYINYYSFPVAFHVGSERKNEHFCTFHKSYWFSESPSFHSLLLFPAFCQLTTWPQSDCMVHCLSPLMSCPLPHCDWWLRAQDCNKTKTNCLAF